MWSAVRREWQWGWTFLVEKHFHTLAITTVKLWWNQLYSHKCGMDYHQCRLCRTVHLTLCPVSLTCCIFCNKKTLSTLWTLWTLWNQHLYQTQLEIATFICYIINPSHLPPDWWDLNCGLNIHHLMEAFMQSTSHRHKSGGHITPIQKVKLIVYLCLRLNPSGYSWPTHKLEGVKKDIMEDGGKLKPPMIYLKQASKFIYVAQFIHRGNSVYFTHKKCIWFQQTLFESKW